MGCVAGPPAHYYYKLMFSGQSLATLYTLILLLSTIITGLYTPFSNYIALILQ